MNRQELIRSIATQLFKYELLNEADACTVDALLEEVSNVIEHELEDYLIISGNLIE